MGYRVIILRDNKYKKTVYKSRTLPYSRDKFEAVYEENKNIKFPKKFTSDKGVERVNYRLLLVKDYEETDKPRMVRDHLGRLEKEEPLFGIWTVIDENPYQYEESFYVYGYDSRTDRKELDFIVDLMMEDISKKELTKSLVVLHNKIIIYNEYQFDIVFCKCHEDAVRLYDVLLGIARSRTFKRIMFMGKASEMLTSQLYEMMMEETGWDYRRVTRTATST